MNRDQILTRLISCLLFVLAALTIAPVAYAQTATSEARAVTIGPLSVVKTADLQFGNILAGPTNGTVFIDTRNGNLSSTGGVTPVAGTNSRATFIIYGGPNQIVEISIPGTINITHTNGSDNMVINQMAIGNGNRNFGTFVRGLLGAVGVYQLTVGGRLNVGADQEAGTYTGTFTMTVDYL